MPDRMTWNDDDQRAYERAATVHQVRRLLKPHFGIDPTNLTDEEVMWLARRRCKQMLKQIVPFIEKMREAGVIPSA